MRAINIPEFFQGSFKTNLLLLNIIVKKYNNSNDIETIEFLNNIQSQVEVIFNKTNNGPRITLENNKHVYDMMPEKFILTDSDLEFNEKLPFDFIEKLVEISEKYNLESLSSTKI